MDGVTVRLVLELMLNAGTKVVPSCAGIVSKKKGGSVMSEVSE